MIDFLMIPAIIGIITVGIYKLFELFVRRRERMMLIEKLDPSQLSDSLPGKLRLPASLSTNALSIGCLLVGMGLGLLVGLLISSNLENYSREITGIAYGGSILLFGGVGLIVSVFVIRKLERKD